ncbi:TetR/AcrR family transcriptional regulator [Thalassotalea marina]|uniref:HTH tetR-type domain-containing protein n=1 Tax=Thalassotalea marina TaxID=1673741 RepID=A0A919BRT3_9GAMM|nr:TetR/AcrR family transcriptional regulator [Thalassotalea marina]GHG05507.1 hypothetical protein GCM10017161_38910 [Thalassotalea marina]
MAPAPKFSHEEQEELILNAAAECILETTVIDFTMSSISKAAGLSMGSIYKHVQCKEDIIFALATRVFQARRKIFQKILLMDEGLTTPEKIIALTLLSPKKIQLYPFDSDLESFSANEIVISRASALWTDRMIKSYEECENIFNKYMHQAAYDGELKLNGNTQQTIDEINLGCWALNEGFQYVDRIIQIRNISEGTDSLKEAASLDAPVVRNMKRLLNSYTWRQQLDDQGIEKAAAILIKFGLR